MLAFCPNWLTWCLWPVQGEQKDRQRKKFYHIKGLMLPVKCCWGGNNNLYFMSTSRERMLRERQKRNTKKLAVEFSRSWKTVEIKRKTRIKNKDHRIFITFLWLRFSQYPAILPLNYNKPQLPPLCVSVCVGTVSLSSQLCPCVLPLLPSSQQTALLVSTLSACFSHYCCLWAHRSEKREMCLLFLSFPSEVNPSSSAKILPFRLPKV